MQTAILSPPDSQPIVIHCTPAAGSLSPSAVAAAIHGPLNHFSYTSEHRLQVTLSVGHLLCLPHTQIHTVLQR